MKREIPSPTKSPVRRKAPAKASARTSGGNRLLSQIKKDFLGAGMTKMKSPAWGPGSKKQISRAARQRNYTPSPRRINIRLERRVNEDQQIKAAAATRVESRRGRV